MTAYALLSLVKLGSKKDMNDARSIVRWLSKQRNSEGGFISTQDTVVGLQVKLNSQSFHFTNTKFGIVFKC
jgi:hypothetical protein